MDPVKQISLSTVIISDSSSFLISAKHSPCVADVEIPNVMIHLGTNVEKGQEKNVVKNLSLDESQSGWRRFHGLLFTLAHVLAFAFAALVGKYLNHYHPFSVSTYRFQGILVPALVVLFGSYARERQQPEGKRKSMLTSIWPLTQNGNWRTIIILCVRSAMGCSSMVLFHYSLKYIQIGDTLIIQAAAPIFTNLLAYFLLNEPTGIFPICLAIFSILGVGIISRPPLLTGAEAFNDEILLGCLFSFGSMLLSVGSIVLLRYLKNVHFSVIAFSLGVWGTFQSLGIALLLGAFQFPEGFYDILLVISLALLVFASQITLTFALKMEEAGPVMLFRTLHCVVGFILQKIFLDIPADVYSILGACIVLFGVVSTIGRKQLSGLPKDHKLRRTLFFVLK